MAMAMASTTSIGGLGQFLRRRLLSQTLLDSGNATTASQTVAFVAVLVCDWPHRHDVESSFGSGVRLGDSTCRTKAGLAAKVHHLLGT